ncbi:hypothetical protein [Myxococcus landrumensis]|uniref:Uncharacterized protein n=1 Tax=Myxococcus landrumensis TaxID=2813577 RepID=A0ABX7N0M4_9BACT|nr:hypothetical protein [Myxococcus landrumus]QSQ12251.1 hypothetical protein JY572_28330 [Myxococcus landrumus]
MKRYFKREAESDLGEGVAYMEITEGWPSRQVEIYGGTWRWADEAHTEWLADQPFEVLDLGVEYEIELDEFEQVWQEALKRCPASS